MCGTAGLQGERTGDEIITLVFVSHVYVHKKASVIEVKLDSVQTLCLFYIAVLPFYLPSAEIVTTLVTLV